MIDLIYPPDLQVSTLPAASAEKVSRKVTVKSLPEFFPVINNDCAVIARAERSYCHGGSHLLHPVVHLHIINRNGEIYLQKRSEKKEIQPGKWDTAVGGHVIFGESIMEALFRESAEELSLGEFNPRYIECYIWQTERDNEFVNVFAAVGCFNLKPDLDEVTEGRWWSVKEIEENLETGVFTPNFVSEYKRIKTKLLSLL